MLCEDSESLAVRPHFDPALGQGCRSAYVERKDLNSKEIAGQIYNVLSRGLQRNTVRKLPKRT